jgi:hypothetical protein
MIKMIENPILETDRIRMHVTERIKNVDPPGFASGGRRPEGTKC